MPGADPPDDATIGDEEPLYYRVYPDSKSLVRIFPSGEYRPSSGSLRSDGPLSVNLGSLATPQETRNQETSSIFHVAAFSAGIARMVGCRIIREPLPGNHAHALVYGKHKSGEGALNKSQIKRIADRARIVLINENALEGVETEDGE